MSIERIQLGQGVILVDGVLSVQMDRDGQYRVSLDRATVLEGRYAPWQDEYRLDVQALLAAGLTVTEIGVVRSLIDALVRDPWFAFRRGSERTPLPQGPVRDLLLFLREFESHGGAKLKLHLGIPEKLPLDFQGTFEADGFLFIVVPSTSASVAVESVRVRRGFTHRVFVVCPACRRLIPAGRFRQHAKVHG